MAPLTMSDVDNKLSPLEFLAELRSEVEQESASPSSDAVTNTIDHQPPDSSDQSDPDEAADREEATAADVSELAEVSGSTDAEQASEASPLPDSENASGRNDNGLMRRGPTRLPDAVKEGSQLSELFDRVHNLLGGQEEGPDTSFSPQAPETIEQTRLTSEEVERLVLKYLLSKGSLTGRQICAQICLPFQIVDPILRELKQERMVTFKGTAAMGDYEFAITDFGRERARRYSEECTYFGAAPVSLQDYLNAMEIQSIAKQEATEEDLKLAFDDLIISQQMLGRLGPAVNSGRGMFLFGEPGNGKTSIAERVTKAFGSTIWIPRALGIDGDIIRLFDPGVHEIVEQVSGDGLFDLSGVDARWVQIVRPTVVAGGELTMQELEVIQNQQTKICEAPLQLKSNCGTLVIDDFGRQTMPVDVLLNRWIVPLEKRYDFLNLPSGKKIQVPFDQLIIFSTNLEPKDLVDDAFLRRVPYKIKVPDPTDEEFRELCELMSPLMGFEYNREAVDYLIETHYRSVNRPFRACQPRDLLLQVRNYCTYKRLPKKMTPEAFDFAVENYFSVL